MFILNSASVLSGMRSLWDLLAGESDVQVSAAQVKSKII